MEKETGSEPKFKTSHIKIEPALKELFLDSLRDIYWAETTWSKRFPK